MDYYYDWKPYVSVAARREQAARAAAQLAKRGRPMSPVVIDGRKIATTFWGRAWCDNLERYSDYATRLPRGRSYVRNRAILDLQIAPGIVKAIVSGSSLYDTQITVAGVAKGKWQAVCRDCGGAIESLIELLQGRLSDRVMTRICDQRTGLFPSPGEIAFSCSCPDWASMCKHVAAVLYAIGARLDQQPDLLFLLRKVDQQELITHAGRGAARAREPERTGRRLDERDLSAMFGIDIATPARVPRSRSVSEKKKGRAGGSRRASPERKVR
jgi:uncharacterized Zn finger protein